MSDEAGLQAIKAWLDEKDGRAVNRFEGLWCAGEPLGSGDVEYASTLEELATKLGVKL